MVATPDQIAWFLIFVLVFVSFYIFTSPFVENRELLNRWTPYVYVSMGLYTWLLLAAVVHVPLTQLGMLEYDVKQPISLFLPIFFSSIVILGGFQSILYLLMRYGWVKHFSSLSFNRVLSNILRNSAAVSVMCCALLVHCDAADDDSAIPKTYNRHVCEQFFGVSGTKIPVPQSYQGGLFIWITGLSLAMVNLVMERLVGFRMLELNWNNSEADEEEDEHDVEHSKLPAEHALPMVPWYSMFVFDTAFELLISLKIFLGRFDMRAMQAAIHPNYEDYMFDHLAEKDDLWLDFMGDCGDGFNSSYQVARSLAQPQLDVEVPPNSPLADQAKMLTLPRGDCLVIGGDLAYPHPCAETYESRFWRTFEYAMKPPLCYDPAAVSTQKPVLPPGCKTLKDYKGPTCFAIPGNHDWFDGLNTYKRFVCHRDWLGGWHLPQQTSYFCLKLPHGWWLFACDLALENDINDEQFACFEAIAKNHLQDSDRVIVVTHEPNWILDQYEHQRTEEKLQYLMTKVLAGRVVLRLAGDIHNYTRHSLFEAPTIPAPKPTTPRPRKLSINTSMTPDDITAMAPFSPIHKHFPHMEEKRFLDMQLDMEPMLDPPQGHPEGGPVHLIVSGGGGAFLHPTHVPSGENLFANDKHYQRASCYPSEKVSRRYALLNIFGFRRRNWRFDFVGGVGYYMLAVSMFPRCSVGEIYESATWRGVFSNFFWELVAMQGEVFTSSYVSLASYLVLFIVHLLFADTPSFPKKAAISLVMSLAHTTAAFSVLIAFEAMFQAATDQGALANEGLYSLYNYFNAHVPNMLQLHAYDYFNVIPLYSTCVKYLLTFFDIPEVVAVHRMKICYEGFDALSRIEASVYYYSVFMYFWVAATPICGVIVGLYLYTALNVFKSHYNEAFSSLRVASYKNFVRMRFTPDGNLEIYALGIDKMPQKWVRDPKWSGAAEARKLNPSPSYEWKYPNYWKPKISKVDNILRFDMEDEQFDAKFSTEDRSRIKLVDHVVYYKNNPSRPGTPARTPTYE
ncbi:hypothetical protein SDRG_07341 [Saprolegnia diclina VS20]|uniref:Uncharacterized protein n=1 Tax=Saprolegnia diclina (strain VS20) TaxID=1156394 RepID=T0RXP3_SAPDV|nr:hypothetical protein SDRG_07341 [Saprolegnia diclina VS20]EQC35107.1 hypothetical protein SDRG_07341 [Saprolegnia diclina VS20]|eukprot:XP_008611391.1 hypothetical protein SDRG_07341 [Saprolegnia diclina VS20]